MKLFTIAVKSFNQVEYIGAAVEAALRQTYRPLEVVVSDDGSTDGSWEAIKATVESVGEQDGVSVKLNRNEKNLGNMGNWMKIGELASGEWIVKADGDDVSMANRVERIAAAVEAGDDSAMVVVHGAIKTDPEGRAIGAVRRRRAAHPLGAVMAFRRDCFTEFGEVKNGRLVDDEVFARRALMLGGEIDLEEPLVRYRMGTGISSGIYDLREPEARCVRQLPESLAQSMEDLEHIRGKLGETEYGRWKARLEKEREEAQIYLELLTGERMGARWRAWKKLDRPPVWKPTWWKMAIYLMPGKIGDRCLRLAGRLRYGLGVGEVARG